MEFAMSNDEQAISKAASPDSRSGTKTRPHQRLWFGLSIFGYVVCYAVLSLLGQCRMVTSGERRYSKTGLGVIDTQEWQPKGLLFRRWKGTNGEMRTEGNLCGYVYSPLIVLDRACVHRTTTFFNN